MNEDFGIEQGKLLMIYFPPFFFFLQLLPLLFGTHIHTQRVFQVHHYLLQMEAGGGEKSEAWLAEAVQIQCAAFLIPTQGFSPLFNASTQVYATPPFLPSPCTSYANIYDDVEKRGVGRAVGGAAVVRTKVAHPAFVSFGGGMCVCVECMPHNGMSDEALSRHNYFFFYVFHSLPTAPATKMILYGVSTQPQTPQVHLEWRDNQSEAVPN